MCISELLFFFTASLKEDVIEDKYPKISKLMKKPPMFSPAVSRLNINTHCYFGQSFALSLQCTLKHASELAMWKHGFTAVISRSVL